MNSKISVIVGSVLALIVGSVPALANTATETVLAKGCDCIGPYVSVDKPVQLPPQTSQIPINSAPKDRVAGGHR
jgi:hypothetical protein